MTPENTLNIRDWLAAEAQSIVCLDVDMSEAANLQRRKKRALKEISKLVSGSARIHASKTKTTLVLILFHVRDDVDDKTFPMHPTDLLHILTFLNTLND